VSELVVETPVDVEGVEPPRRPLDVAVGVLSHPQGESLLASTARLALSTQANW